MRIRFTELPIKLKYPPHIKGKLSTMHSELVTYACSHYKPTTAFKRQLIYCFNVASYYCISGDSIPQDWDISNPFVNVPIIDESLIYSTIQQITVFVDDVIWDIYEPEDDETAPAISSISSSRAISSSPVVSVDTTDQCKSTECCGIETPVEDLYFQPEVPLLDYSRLYAQKTIDGVEYVIYTSLPDIPTRQCEISITTDPNSMSTNDYLRLFPQQLFYTRPASLYTHIEGCDYIEDIGCIIPISGFTTDQILDNIIKYPHVEGIVRLGKQDGRDRYVPFWKFIELNGQLHKITDVWDGFEEVRHLPKSQAIVSEYVVRRYLLERDVFRVDHTYTMFGDLSPFITLFMPISKYAEFGYADSVKIAEQCVQSRIQYLRSRNPILRRINRDV